MIDQPSIEYRLAPKHIKTDTYKGISQAFNNQITNAIPTIHEWIARLEWDSKNIRKDKLSRMDLHELITEILTIVTLHAQTKMPYISIASMITIGAYDSKRDNIQTACELLVLLEKTKLYEISSTHSGQKYIQSLVDIPDVLINRLNLSCFLPPMIEKPKKVYNNRMSGYLTFNDSLILGFKENSHDYPLALDVINTLNRNEYELDEYILDNFDKPWHRQVLSDDDLGLMANDEQEQYHQELANYEAFQEQFRVLKQNYRHKTLWFNHKYDKRGRIYSQGYHFNPQGSSFEKACLNLKHKEKVYGEL